MFPLSFLLFTSNIKALILSCMLLSPKSQYLSSSQHYIEETSKFFFFWKSCREAGFKEFSVSQQKKETILISHLCGFLILLK